MTRRPPSSSCQTAGGRAALVIEDRTAPTTGNAIRETAGLGTVAALNICFSFAIQSFVLLALGANAETDALFAATALPQFVINIVAGGLVRILLPYFTVHGSDHDPRSLTWDLLIWLGGLAAALGLAVAMTASIWVPLLYASFDHSQTQLTVGLTRIQAPTIAFTVCGCVLTAAAHGERRFVWVEVTSTLGSVLTLGALWWGIRHYGVLGAAWALALRPAAQCLFLVGQAGRPRLVGPSQVLRSEIWQRLQPTLFASAYYKSSLLLDRVVAAWAPAGGLSLFYFSQQLCSAATHLLDRSVVTSGMPHLAELGRTSQFEALRQAVRSRLKIIGGLTFVAVTIIVVAGRPLLFVVFAHGRLTPDEISTVHTLMVALGGSIVGASVAQLAAGAFYVSGLTRVPALVGSVGFTVGALIKVVFAWTWGLTGLAWATSLHQMFNAAILLALVEWILRRPRAQ